MRTLALGSREVDLPVDLVPVAERAAVARVRRDPTVRRPLEARRVRAPVAVFERLLADLPRAASLVERIGAGRYEIAPVGGGAAPGGSFTIDDRDGAHARVDRVHDAPGERIYLARGWIRVRPLPSVAGTGVVVLRFEGDGDGATRVGGQIFFRVDSRALHAIARPLARLLRAVIDWKVKRLQAAAIAACEAEAAAAASAGPAYTRAAGNRSG